jgi:hypothetical protein
VSRLSRPPLCLKKARPPEWTSSGIQNLEALVQSGASMRVVAPLESALVQATIRMHLPELTF